MKENNKKSNKNKVVSIDHIFINKDEKKSVSIERYNKICLSYIKKYKKPEEWRPVTINGISTKYIVSNYGRVANTNNMKFIPPHRSNDHYFVSIVDDLGNHYHVGTYRLVALMFIPVPEKYIEMGYELNELVVDHKRDGDEDNFDDNTVWNLQWLTYRENTSKASKNGYRNAFAHDFRKELDQMILDGKDNVYIYEKCKEKYGYEKSDIKATLQVRRRRLGVTLKEHHERDKEFTKKVDELIKKGLSNDEIMTELDMERKGRSSARLLQYRRSLLSLPANKSKYMTNEVSDILNILIESGLSTSDIIQKLFSKMDDTTKRKIAATISSRRVILRNKKASSTTIEN